ncbi:hypothetical protein scyTo_0002820 [Scyliorhinus torazame]|uniref:Uncharacterized protein n=1 Tax=Scyliorhinus torazame TaxID=75743 RepID=A0A401PKT6_SCYTO|nr:hypothetical protein [Scyliorhinus torazame]
MVRGPNGVSVPGEALQRRVLRIKKLKEKILGKRNGSQNIFHSRNELDIPSEMVEAKFSLGYANVILNYLQYVAQSED